ncbi:Disease resistance-responsive dirigent-like family protein [Prunus dulcis]|uniref:Dirigent protein n=1 Tax=Prunus dulcis TaxID=3755 RepID=A0A4Y1R7J8_PRUDU|nr:dirigent protein 1-like [Prunus dulcis]KAI5340299.1 hypothetical protein L3X38_019573 [Prunus dulcis]BBG99985.1 Disease resistance-responsive dirigent-like family protein [Prunus dulcis]
MALNFIPKLLLVLAFAAFSAGARRSELELKETHLSLFFHDIASGPNFTLIPVAGIAGKLWTFDQFGTAFVTDDPLTETPDRSAPIVGRGQGIYVTSGLDGRNTHVLISIVFTNKKYNGSTLEIQGTSKQFEKVREVSVVSGTGQFRFARGYATFETYLWDPATFYSVERCNVTVQHY